MGKLLEKQRKKRSVRLDQEIMKDSSPPENTPVAFEMQLTGLSSVEAARRLREEGPNILAKERKSRPMRIFLGQFKDVMVMILLAATVVSVLLGEITDAITIILIVLVNAVLGFIQEYRTEKTIEMLSKMTAPTARCWRDGKLTVVPASQLVRGDMVELEAGDRVPADCLLLEAKGLFSDEAILTGESVPAEKTAAPPEVISRKQDNQPGRRDVVYGGCILTKGRGRGRIIATGLQSQMGRISGMLTDIVPEQTPLQKKLGELGRVVAILCLAVCAIVFAAGVLRGEPIFDMVLTGISIAIAAIPEGLPATVTIALALAVNRMLKQDALVHRLHSVETLGCTSVICTDKTGTITENRMTVTRLEAGGQIFDVLGSGTRIAGELRLNGARVNPAAAPALRIVLEAGVLCSTASIRVPDGTEAVSSRERGRLTAQGQWETWGDPTEVALLVAAAKGGITADSLSRNYRKVEEIPFDSETRCMTVITASISGARTAWSKGAVDVILSRCDFVAGPGGLKDLRPLTISEKKRILAENDKMAGDALRVLAFACREVPTGSSNHTPWEHGMVFLGLSGMLDPPRAEAKKAVGVCRRAGIKTVMITGDHKNTAAAIARQAGILPMTLKASNALDDGHSAAFDRAVMTGETLSHLSDEELADRIEDVRVFARVDPADKLRIVRALKTRGHIVTMTGDGVNDAPAVKEAHIGVSMGITGTDVTKQAADVILLDDNFATLVSAVEQGRTVYANIRKFVRYLLSCNIGEVITMFFGILLGLPLILLPAQLLLVNLVTDGLPAIALGMEPSEDSFMREKPRSPKAGFFSGGLMSMIIIRGILIGVCTLGCFMVLQNMGASLATARTGALFTLVMSQLFHVFECKSERKNIFTVPYLSNWKLLLAVLISAAILISAMLLPPLQLVFSTVPLSQVQLLVSLGFSAGVPLLYAIFGRKRR